MTNKETEITGVVLAGGKSRRFGSNKALAQHHNKPLIQHVTDIIDQEFSQKLLITNTPEDYNFLNWPMAGDIFSDQGPLAGIHAALSKAQGPIFITACDMPLISPNLIQALIKHTSPNIQAIVPQSVNGLEPLFAVYSQSCLPIITDLLENNQRRIFAFIKIINSKIIELDDLIIHDPELNSFRNINRQEDLVSL